MTETPQAHDDRDALSPSALKTLGMSAQPFVSDPHPDAVYRDLALDRIGKQLLIETLPGRCALLCGQPGSGKTTLLGELHRIAPAHARVLRLRATPLSRFEPMQRDVQTQVRALQEGEAAAASRNLTAEGPIRAWLVVIDDADTLPEGTTIDWLHWQREHGRDGARRIGLILAGSPALASRVEEARAASNLAESCSRIDLGALTREQTEAYLHHRLLTAGAAQPALLRGTAADAIFRESQGNPSWINAAATQHLRQLAGGGTSDPPPRDPEPSAETGRATPPEPATNVPPPPVGPESPTRSRQPPPWLGPGLTVVAGVLIVAALINIFLLSGQQTDKDDDRLSPETTRTEPLVRPSTQSIWRAPGNGQEAADPAPAQEPRLVPAPPPVPQPLHPAPTPRAETEALQEPPETDAALAQRPDPADETRDPAIDPTSDPAVEPAPEPPPTPAREDSAPRDVPPARAETDTTTAEPGASAPPPAQAATQTPIPADGTPARSSALQGPDWLRSKSRSRFTIQIAAGHDLSALQSLGESLAIGDTEVGWYRSERGGRDWYGLVIGDYPNMASAVSAESRLPAEVRRDGPWIRRFGAVQDAMK